MDSIALGWKKQGTGKVIVPNKKQPTQQQQQHHSRKVHRSKQQEPKQIIELQTSRKVPLDNLDTEIHPYTPVPKPKTSRKSFINPANLIGINQDERLCSVRSAIATFVIIAIILIAAGVAVGVIFASIKTGNSSGSGSTSVQNPYSTVSTGLYTSSVSIGNQTGLPCSGYTQINDPTRNYNYTYSSSSCDNGALFNVSGGSSWIRFVGSGGTTIPFSSPGLNHCGGYLSSWQNSSLPTAQNIISSAVICFETYAHICGFSVTISVVYCPGNYYVYLLPALVVCNARYCTQ